MELSETKTKITDGGRVVIPAEYRKVLGMNVGDEVVIFLEKDELRIISRNVALKKAQDIVKSYATSRNLSDELIKERRQEAEESIR